MKLVYDVSSTPKGLSIADLVKIQENHRVVFWDSTLGGTRPKIYSDDMSDMVLVDVLGRDVDLDTLMAEFKNKEFWEKELHYCKNSPIYYYKNYLTPVYPVQDNLLREYLSSLNLSSDIPSDSESATALLEKQKVLLAEAMKDLTVETLMEKAAVTKTLEEEYKLKIKRYEELVSEVIYIKNMQGDLLPEHTVKKELIDYIKTFKLIPVKYNNYKTPAGTWGAKMLQVTDYAVLLEIVYDLRFKDDVLTETPSR